ncbi:pyridoxamine 5'-phosphate oxidase family protein [Candidatus Thorarchaeota archaeon]|nr:MAG: pyridoxamine 5'-phosphate oxidase family protein [Candidatus Thorarchaeota archaeon]
MFREMRKKTQLLSETDTIEILQSCTSGVLAVTGDNDYPYAVPLSFAYKDGKLFFHCAKAGYKLECIVKNNKVSFCVIQKDDVKQKTFTTHFRSAIVFGTARILTEDSEKKYALECLVEKYSPDYITEGSAEIERNWDRVCAAELQIEHMTGKAAKELINRKE